MTPKQHDFLAFTPHPRAAPTRFQPGNQAAAKPKWSTAQVLEFQNDLRQLRERLRLTYPQMARALGYSTFYVKQMEGFYPHRRQQPSEAFARQVEALRAAPPTHHRRAGLGQISSKYKLPPGEILLLARARKCPGCKRYVILPYANQKYCDADCRQRAAKRKGVKR